MGGRVRRSPSFPNVTAVFLGRPPHSPSRPHDQENEISPMLSLSETVRAMSGLLSLADVCRDPRFTPEQLDALTAAAPNQIGPWITRLNEWRFGQLRSGSGFPDAVLVLGSARRQGRTQ
jgi:hypothetical protein